MGVKNKMLIALAIIVSSAFGLIVYTSYNAGLCSANAADCQESDKSVEVSQIDNIEQEIAAGALLIDVREPDEFASEHAVGAVNLPLSEIQTGKYPDINNTKKVYLYCRSGNRASMAQEILKQAGYSNIENLGGLSDWKSIGGQTISN